MQAGKALAGPSGVDSMLSNCSKVDRGNKKNSKKKKKKKRGGSKRKMTPEQAGAFRAILDWVYSDKKVPAEFEEAVFRGQGRLVFELHSHSKCSDGFMSPTGLVDRAHSQGVKVLALTDHDTLAGIPEAVEAASRYDMRIIPGVEISTIFVSQETETEEPVHILAYYSSCGASRHNELEVFLENIRNGRYIRAKEMVSKLNKLGAPIKWESVTRIAGAGVAPGRLHVARALVEAGYVENLKQAFTRYLYDGGPAYSTGSEPVAQEAIQMVRKTGGLAVLAHPWALKAPVAIIKNLADAGLHGVEVYRSDGKLSVFSDLADTYGLLKLGGSDFHGRGNSESELGSVNIPVLDVHEFLVVARPLWLDSLKMAISNYIEDPTASNLATVTKFGPRSILNGQFQSKFDLIDSLMSHWLTEEERQTPDFEVLKLKFSKEILKC